MPSKKPIPNRKPSAAGITAHFPSPAAISIAGINSDHTEAATITPEAKPNNIFCNSIDICFFIKNTNAEPNIVPNKGINNPIVKIIITFIFYVSIFKVQS